MLSVSPRYVKAMFQTNTTTKVNITNKLTSFLNDKFTNTILRP